MAWSIFSNGGGSEAAVGWAQQFLTALGAPVTPGNVQFVYQWETAEGGGGKYNPLNTGPVSQHPEWTTTGEQFGGGAADYASWDAGIMGPVYYLEHYQQATYGPILAALRANNPSAARAALWASPWAASHYGYGSNWPLSTTVPGGTPILPASVGSGVSTASAVTTVADETCAWQLNLSISHPCVLSKPQARALIGGVLIIGAALIGVVGTVLLVAYGLKETSAGRAAGKAVTTLTPVGRIAGAVT